MFSREKSLSFCTSLKVIRKKNCRNANVLDTWQEAVKLVHV